VDKWQEPRIAKISPRQIPQTAGSRLERATAAVGLITTPTCS